MVHRPEQPSLLECKFWGLTPRPLLNQNPQEPQEPCCHHSVRSSGCSHISGVPRDLSVIGLISRSTYNFLGICIFCPSQDSKEVSRLNVDTLRDTVSISLLGQGRLFCPLNYLQHLEQLVPAMGPRVTGFTLDPFQESKKASSRFLAEKNPFCVTKRRSSPGCGKNREGELFWEQRLKQTLSLESEQGNGSKQAATIVTGVAPPSLGAPLPLKPLEQTGHLG